MANTTSKSTKAKTKTTKQTNAKASVKANKVVKAATAKKPVAKKSTKPVSVNVTNAKSLLLQRLTTTGVKTASLRRLHAISALVFVVLGMLAGAFMKATDYQLSMSYAVKDSLLETFVSAQHVMLNIDLKWVVVAILTLSALLSIARMTRLSVSEARGLKVKVQPWRWVDFAVTGASMMAVTAVLYGVQELTALKLVGVLTVVAVVLAWIAERENASASKVVKGAYLASVIAGLVVLCAVAGNGLSTVVYGLIRAPWYAYALFGGAVFTMVLISLNQYLGFRGKKAWGNYAFVERNYILINLLAKSAFAVILIIGLWNK